MKIPGLGLGAQALPLSRAWENAGCFRDVGTQYVGCEKIANKDGKSKRSFQPVLLKRTFAVCGFAFLW
jgi:hypothetical protein